MELPVIGKDLLRMTHASYGQVITAYPIYGYIPLYAN
jgi:hypothetical protein